MVSHIAWDDSYKVGHNMIDKQLQRLFELADGLYNLVAAGEQGREHIQAVIKECAEYVSFHFASEEELMDEVCYSGMEAHVKAHRAFSDYVASLMEEFTSGKEIDLGELYSFVANWLVQHITVEDKKLAEQVRILLYGG